jgi:hypothetical protein
VATFCHFEKNTLKKECSAAISLFFGGNHSPEDEIFQKKHLRKKHLNYRPKT